MDSSITQPLVITITADKQIILMGKSVLIEAVVTTRGEDKPQFYILLPFVDRKRWGTHERPDASGKARFLLPLPNPGKVELQILAIRSDTSNWMGLENQELLWAGTPMPDQGIVSKTLEVNVLARKFKKHVHKDSLFCIQWENWFAKSLVNWKTAHAVPVYGFYDCHNRDILRQQILWFMDLEIDFIMADWSNNLWGLKHWNDHPAWVNTLIETTFVTLEVLADMRDEGLPVPKFTLLTGISNGKPATMEALNEEHAWIYENYVANPRFEGLWQEYDGKPLIMPLDTGIIGHPKGTAESAFRIPFFKHTLELSEVELDAFRTQQPPVDDSRYTIRWISSQNQTTRHHELGHWSWMDGNIAPMVTYRNRIAEAVTITPTFFNALGWKGPLAYGRRGGTTFLETFKVAQQHRPKVIFLHQFNEFTGQAEGKGMGIDQDIYADSYSVELSDDLEPVSLTAPGYRGDQGGWGFYYLNLTQALMAVYHGKAKDCTVLAVATPQPSDCLGNDFLKISWTAVGKIPEHYSLAIDGTVLYKNIYGTEVEISLRKLAKGSHILTIIADGCTTRYPLSSLQLDERLGTPIPVKVDFPIIIA